MQVFIMRHGQAAIEAASDAARPLTSQGVHESHQIATWLLAQGVTLQRALVSPYLRAQQTLNVLRDSFTLLQEPETIKILTPNGDAAQVSSYLQLLAEQGVMSVLLVSHLPLVGYLVTELCPIEPVPMFATSSMACIELSPQGNGKLLWQVSPGHLSE